MLGSGNKKNNNAMNIRQQQYQEIEGLEEITSTPKQKYYYQNAYININNNNNTINNIKKQNNSGNMNSNLKMMNLKNNIKNMNIPNKINSEISNNNINRALLVIRNEFKKKDDRIKFLELKVAELERKINIIINSSQQNNNKILNENNIIQLNKNFTFADKNSGEMNNINSNNSLENPKIDIGVGNFRVDNNINYIPQTKSSNQFKINNNQYNLEKQYSNNSNNANNNVNDKLKENSVFTGNSSNSKVHSKSEVKSYLKEVKEKVEPSIFKEFISNIKLLTSSKEKNGVDRKEIIENVKLLFGEEYKDLFIKFQLIIGANE